MVLVMNVAVIAVNEAVIAARDLLAHEPSLKKICTEEVKVLNN